VLDKLDVAPGLKTYFVCLVGIVVNVLVSQGVIDVGSISLINTLLGFLGLGTVRMAVTR